MTTRSVLVAAILAAALALPVASHAADAYALVSGGTALVPLRAIFQFLGAQVDYSSGGVTATRGSTVIRLSEGSRAASRNGRPVRLSAAPKLVDGKLYVPLRFVSEALGAQVDYEETGRAVTVSDARRGSMGLVVVKDKGAWRTYQGAWFDVDFPAGFSVVNMEPSASMQGGPYYESARFMSPDGAVEFYVFSPQWRGQSDWAKVWADEKPGEVKHQRSGSRLITWGSATGPGGKYQRAWVQTEDEATNTNHVFGIKYTSQAAYNRHKAQYLRFKGSLVQYAD